MYISINNLLFVGYHTVTTLEWQQPAAHTEAGRDYCQLLAAASFATCHPDLLVVVFMREYLRPNHSFDLQMAAYW